MNKLTACEAESLELGDYEQLAAVLLEGQVAEPLEDLRHLLGAPVVEKRRGFFIIATHFVATGKLDFRQKN